MFIIERDVRSLVPTVQKENRGKVEGRFRAEKSARKIINSALRNVSNGNWRADTIARRKLKFLVLMAGSFPRKKEEKNARAITLIRLFMFNPFARHYTER